MGWDGFGGIDELSFYIFVLMFVFINHIVMKPRLKLGKYVLIICVFFCANQNIVFSQGYVFIKEDFQKLPAFDLKSYGFAESLPSSHSLRKYAPTPQYQEGETCVGWALGYAAMSISYNKLLNTTQSTLKDIFAFDPLFTYGLLKDQKETACDSATSFYGAINQLLSLGCKRLVMPPAFISCDDAPEIPSERFSKAYIPLEVYSIDLEKVSSLNEKINLLKSFLSDGNPLTFGMNTPKSFAGNKGSDIGDESKLWLPQKNETFIGGHAMCLIGYNNSKYGGAFEIMNSWGVEYGDGGFIWIKYADFINYINEVILIDVTKPNSSKCRIGDCDNGYSNILLNSGAIYEGIMENGLPNDFGVLIWPDNTFYTGGWNHGKRNGVGLYFDKGEIYKLEFIDDELIQGEVLGFANKKDLNEIMVDEIESLMLAKGIAVKGEVSKELAEEINGKKIN